MTGSIKDRMALHILKQAYLTGRIKPGDTIAEATSGNTGIAFAAIGRALGHPVTVFMPDWMSHERMALISEFRRVDRAGEPRPGRVPRQHPHVGGAGGARRAGVPAVPVLERSQRRRPHAHDRSGNLVPAAPAGPDARRVRRGHRHRRHGHGGGPLPANEEPGHPGVSARAGGVADDRHGPQSGAAPHSGHLRRVHPGAGQAGRTGAGHRGVRRRLHHHGAETRERRPGGRDLFRREPDRRPEDPGRHRSRRRRGDGAAATATRSTSARIS